MADNFKVPSTIPGDDPGVDIHALERTVDGNVVKVGVTVNVDPDDPTKRQRVDGTYGGAVDVKRLPGTVETSIGATAASLETIAADIALIKAALDVPVSTLTTPADVQPVSGAVSVSGVATAANQATEISALESIAASVDGLESAAATSDARLANVETAIALIKAKTDNLDVALSTLTTPSDTQPVSGSVGGDVAHDGADSGNPVKIGGVAAAHGSSPSAVAAGDRVNLLANRHGILFALGGHPAVVTRRDNYTSAQTDTAIVSVPSGSTIVVVRQSVLASNANTVDVAARVGFGATTTPTGAGVVLSHPGIAKGSGVVEGNGGGILGWGADGEDLRITSGAPTGGSIDVVTSYFVIES